MQTITHNTHTHEHTHHTNSLELQHNLCSGHPSKVGASTRRTRHSRQHWSLESSKNVENALIFYLKSWFGCFVIRSATCSVVWQAQILGASLIVSCRVSAPKLRLRLYFNFYLECYSMLPRQCGGSASSCLQRIWLAVAGSKFRRLFFSFGQVVQFACVPLNSNLGRYYSRNRPMGSRCSCTALAYLLYADFSWFSLGRLCSWHASHRTRIWAGITIVIVP